MVAPPDAALASVQCNSLNADEIIEHWLLFFHGDFALVELGGAEVERLQHRPF